MVVGFFAISVYSGVVAYADLQTQNSTDAGIITQAVASTAHGHVAPFYESYDCLVKMRCSFLLVHPGVVLYAAVPFYDLAPTTVTLFALRSAVVAAAAVPLYWLTRQVTKSPAKGLLAAGLFLVWAPSLVGDAFSLHLESLLPLELFSLAALWQSGRYRLGLGVALVAFLTFEIFPLFTFLVGAFFLLPYIERPIRRQWRRWRNGTTDAHSIRSTIALGLGYVRETARLREVQYISILMGASLAAYVVLALFINLGGHAILGVAAPPVPPGLIGIFTNPSSPAGQSVGTILQSSQTVNTAEYWLILYALVGFIPLLAPRTLVISIPWIGWTFLTDSDRFTTIGHQYSLIAAGPIFIGLAYGLRRVQIGRPSTTDDSAVLPAMSNGPLRAPWRRQQGNGRIAWAAAFAVVVAANGVLLPINPVLPALGANPGAPFEPGFFDHSLEIDPAFTWMEEVVSTIPYDATIAATPPIFPLVANDPHAYVLVNSKTSELANLPFNVSGGPEYVFVDSTSSGVMGPNLTHDISNPLVYGLRGYVGSTTLGPVLLYQKGYVGPAQLFGPAVPQVAAAYTPGNGLNPGGRGMEESNSSSPSGKVIVSLDEVSRAGLVWTGPNTFLSPGNYTVEVQVAIAGPNFTRDPEARVLRISVEGVGGPPINATLSASSFAAGQFLTLMLNVSLINPILDVNVQGILLSDQFSMTVASVSIEPDQA